MSDTNIPIVFRGVSSESWLLPAWASWRCESNSRAGVAVWWKARVAKRPRIEAARRPAWSASLSQITPHYVPFEAVMADFIGATANIRVAAERVR